MERRFETLKAGSIFRSPPLDERQGLWAGIKRRDRPALLQERQRHSPGRGCSQSRRPSVKQSKNLQQERPDLAGQYLSRFLSQQALRRSFAAFLVVLGGYIRYTNVPNALSHLHPPCWAAQCASISRAAVSTLTSIQ